MSRKAADNSNRTKVQQLLAAIGKNNGEKTAQVEAVDYDWHQPHFFNSRQTKKLNDYAAKAATLITEKFGNLCQRSFEVTITSISEHFAGQFLGQLPSGQSQSPDNFYLPFRLGQEPPCGFISIPPQTAVIWATQLLGDAETKENSAKQLSDLEAAFLFDMTSLIVKALSEIGEKCPFASACDGLANVLPLQLKGEEEFCKITLEIKKTGAEKGTEAHILILCEKLAQAIGETTLTNGKFTPEAIAKAMQSHIEKIPVPVTAQLATVAVSVEDVLNLAPGDVLLLDKKINEPAQLIAAGKTVCRGICAKLAGNYALSVIEAGLGTTQSLRDESLRN